MSVLSVALCVTLLFVAERLLAVRLTRRPAVRDWIRAHPILHPNSISLVRIPMGVMTILLWTFFSPAFAIVWFAFWMITDLTDGTIARNCGLATERGKWLDPLSDKCMVLPPLLFFALGPRIDAAPPLAAVVLIIAADVFGQTARLFVSRTAANLFGKAKTAMTTLLLGLVALHQLSPLLGVTPAGIVGVTYLTAVLALLSVFGKTAPPHYAPAVLVLGNLACGILATALAQTGRVVAPILLMFLVPVLSLLDEDRGFDAPTPWRAAYQFSSLPVLAAATFMLMNAMHSTPWAGLVFGGAVAARLFLDAAAAMRGPDVVPKGLAPLAATLLAVGGTLCLAAQSSTPAWASPFFAVVPAGLLLYLPIKRNSFAEQFRATLPNMARVAIVLLLLLGACVALGTPETARAPLALVLLAAGVLTLLATAYEKPAPAQSRHSAHDGEA